MLIQPDHNHFRKKKKKAMNGKRLAAVEHTKFTFDDLKVTFCDNRDGQPNCLALAHAYNGVTNNNYNNSKAIMQFNWN